MWRKPRCRGTAEVTGFTGGGKLGRVPKDCEAPRDEAAAGLEVLAAGGGITSRPRVSPAGMRCAGCWR